MGESLEVSAFLLQDFLTDAHCIKPGGLFKGNLLEMPLLEVFFVHVFCGPAGWRPFPASRSAAPSISLSVDFRVCSFIYGLFGVLNLWRSAREGCTDGGAGALEVG